MFGFVHVSELVYLQVVLPLLHMAMLVVLQPFQWRCVECAIHHEWDVHEE